MPNYGTCVEPNQNEISRSHVNIKAKPLGTNDRNNSNPGEITVMDKYQMKRMFQCDPSQLPAEEVPPSPQNDLFIIYGLKSSQEPKSQICELQPKQTVQKSRNIQEQKNNSLSLEVPHKIANILAKNEETDERSPQSDSNSTNYFCQPEKEFFEQQHRKFPISNFNQLMATINQVKPTETTLELMALNLKEPKVDEHLEATWNQTELKNEKTWSVNKEPKDKPHSLSMLFSESTFDAANPNKETVNLELYHSNQETKCNSVPNQLKHHPELESSGCFAKGEQPVSFIQKSRTTHQFDNWSSESDDEEDNVYHKLSEAEEEKETERSPEFVAPNYTEKVKDFTEISHNMNLNLDIQSFIRTKQLKVNTNEPCYKQLRESSLPSNLSSTSNKLTPEESVSFSSIDDLK